MREIDTENYLFEVEDVEANEGVSSVTVYDKQAQDWPMVGFHIIPSELTWFL